MRILLLAFLLLQFSLANSFFGKKTNSYQIYLLKEDICIQKAIKSQSFKKRKQLLSQILSLYNQDYWIKVPLQNNTFKEQKKSLIFFWTNAVLDLYYIKKDSKIEKPIRLKDVDREGILIDDFTLKAKENVDLYIKVKNTKKFKLFKMLSIVDEKQKVNLLKKQLSFFNTGLFFGLLVMSLLFALITYFAINKKSLLLYALFISGTLAYISDLPHAFFDEINLPKDMIFIHDNVLLPIVILVSFFLFIKYFFETKKIKEVDIFLNIAILLVLFCNLYNFIFDTQHGNIYIVIFLPLFSIMGLLFIKEYRISATFYSISSISLFFIYLYYESSIFHNVGTLSSFYNYLQISISLTAILLTFSVYRRLKGLFIQKVAYEKELQAKSKFAAMGEMIGNIAHQWRQPLSIISTDLMSLQMKNKFKVLDSKEIDSKVKQANVQLQYMSQTIEDFLNFFSKDKRKESFYIKDAISNALLLVQATFHVHHIKTNLNLDNTKIETYKNELIQALTIILANAKDALKQQEGTRLINIECFEKKIIIEDSAGGIEEKIIEKIFEPYFSTKENKNGTGLGLYTAKIIIEKNIGGVLKVENSVKGAKFIIDLNKS